MNTIRTSVPVGFDYVLVLEWLADGDARTGAQLHEFLQSIGYRSELVVCHSWEDIEQALIAARGDAAAKGVPSTTYGNRKSGTTSKSVIGVPSKSVLLLTNPCGSCPVCRSAMKTVCHF